MGPRRSRSDSTRKARRRSLLPVLSTVSPGILWIVVLLIVPALSMLTYSFLTRMRHGRVGPPFTFENYLTFIGFTQLGYDPLYLAILGKTLLLALGVTVLSLLAGYPLAFFIARAGP